MMRSLAPLFILICLTLESLGQDIDSLERRLKEANLKDTERIEILNLLSRTLTFINPPRALEFANEALKLSTLANNKTGLANAYRNLSSIYSYNSFYFQSMEYIQRALVIFQSMGDSVGIANCYISLGHAYRGLQSRQQEVYYHKKSYEIFIRLKIPERIGVAAHNLGESYFNIGEWDKSRQMTLYAIKINDSIKNLSVLSSCYKVMGMLEYSRKDYQQADIYLNKVLAISSELGENSQKVATVESLIGLAAIYKVKGDTKTQLIFLKKAVEFSTKNNLSGYLEAIYMNLVLFFSRENNQNEVQKYIAEFVVVSDSINSRQLKDRSNLASSILVVHALEQDKIKLEEDQLLNDERLRTGKIILVVAILIAVILIWLVMKLYGVNQKIQAANQIFKNQGEIIETQRQHLETLNITKDKFFRIVAHDLKSPLYSLKSFSNLLAEQILDMSKEEIAEMGLKLSVSVENTIKMADNLIEWARLQMNEYTVQPEKVYVSEIVSNTYDVYKNIAESKGITVDRSMTDHLAVNCDRNQITFVIRNLLNNAIKYSRQGGVIKLTADSMPENKVRIAVSDNGIGISGAMMKNLFTVGGNQSKLGTAGEKGTGLGLVLSYEFVKLNSGTIDVESEVDKGTTFSVILPASP